MATGSSATLGHVAIVLLTRIAIILAPIGVRVVQWASGPGAETVTHAADRVWHLLTDPAVPDADLSTMLSEATATTVHVTTYNAPFEVRRVQLSWELDGGALSKEDVRVCTFHLMKLAAGVPTDAWVAGDFTTAKNAFEAWWTAVKIWFPDNLSWTSLKFYKEGPAIEPPQPPVFSQGYALIGGSVAVCLPPQVAMSVTEKAGDVRHWGRFFLPAPAVSKTGPVDALSSFGRWSAAIIADIGAATETMYETLNAASLQVVVYRAPLPVRQTSAEKRAGTLPGSLPARAGSAWSVTDLQVDDVVDVIRSRRFDAPLTRSVRAISGS